MNDSIRTSALVAAMLLSLTLAHADDAEVSKGLDPAVNADAATARPVASDALQLDTTSIRGNQELPKVLYIVPWKDPSVGNLVGKPVNSLVDEVLAPVDRDVFRRQTSYFEQLYPHPEAGSGD